MLIDLSALALVARVYESPKRFRIARAEE